MPWMGMTSLSTASLTMLPRMTLTKSIRPSAASCSRMTMPVGVSMPSGRVSSTAMRTPTRYWLPTRLRMARSTASGKRMRFSKLPPHSSVRWLVAGDQN